MKHIVYSTFLVILAIACEMDPVADHLQKAAREEASGQLEAALLAYEKVLEIDSNHTSALFHSANILQQQGRYREALPYYRQALQTIGGYEAIATPKRNEANGSDRAVIPDSFGISIIFQQSIAFLEADYYQDAYKGFGHCIKNDYRPGESYYYLGRVFEDSGRPDIACNYFRKAVNLSEGRSTVKVAELCGG